MEQYGNVCAYDTDVGMTSEVRNFMHSSSKTHAVFSLHPSWAYRLGLIRGGAFSEIGAEVSNRKG